MKLGRRASLYQQRHSAHTSISCGKKHFLQENISQRIGQGTLLEQNKLLCLIRSILLSMNSVKEYFVNSSGHANDKLMGLSVVIIHARTLLLVIVSIADR